MRALDGAIALDVALLARHPDVHPGRARLLAVAVDAPLEPLCGRRLDPDADVVRVAEDPVERADPFDDDDPARCNALRPSVRLRPPVPDVEEGDPVCEKRLEHLLSEALDVESPPVPERVGRNDLRVGDCARERRLARAAVSADPDEDRVAAVPRGSDQCQHRLDVHVPTLPSVRMEKIRLGGMALANGVLVHGPTSWAATVRLEDGSLRTASGRVPRISHGSSDTPFVRGPVRIAESLALLPLVRRRLPEARFAFERRAVGVGLVVGTVGAAILRRAPLRVGLRETLAALVSLTPALISLRGGETTGYHGAEHVSIGSYELGEAAPKEHDRCGSHLVGPLVATSAIASAVASRAPAGSRNAVRLAGSVAALGAAVEVFGWMSRNPERRLARALARPGHELQARLSTVEPTPSQLEVAETALRACLEAEGAETL